MIALHVVQVDPAAASWSRFACEGRCRQDAELPELGGSLRRLELVRLVSAGGKPARPSSGLLRAFSGRPLYALCSPQ